MTGPVASTYGALWRRDLGATMRELAAAGFRRVELLAAPPHVDLEDVSSATKVVRSVTAETDLRVHSVVPSGVDVNLASVQEGMRRWSLHQFASAIRFAAAIGAGHVIVHPGRRHPLRPPTVELLHGFVRDAFAALCQVAEGEGVSLLLENVPSGVIDTADECLSLVRELDGKLGLCYDVANGFMVEDVPEGLTIAAPHLRLVHLSDTTRRQWLHAPIGEGEVAWPEVSAALARIGYQGPFVLETLHRGSLAEGMARDLLVLSGARLDLGQPVGDT